MPPRQPARRVVLVINNMGGGGAERVLATLANYLHGQLGWQVTIVTLQGGPVRYPLLPGVEVRSLHGRLLSVGVGNVLGLPLLALELAWFLRRRDADAVMSFLVRSNLILVLTRWLGNRRRIIISERCATDVQYAGDTAASRMIRRLITTFYPLADRIVAISKGVKDSLVRLHVPGERVRVIYNPQQLDEIVASLPANGRPRPAGDPFTIVAAGRLTAQKDYPTLFEAVRQLCREGLDVRLVIFGEGPDEAKLRTLARELEIDARIEWRGWVPSPHAEMAACDAFVITSRWEGFGNVIVEAMACGLPVVCTDCESGPREILGDGEYGLLVPVRDSAAVAAALRQFVADPALRAKYRALGLERARDFDVTRIVEQYVAVLTGDAQSGALSRESV